MKFEAGKAKIQDLTAEFSQTSPEWRTHQHPHDHQNPCSGSGSGIDEEGGRTKDSFDKISHGSRINKNCCRNQDTPQLSKRQQNQNVPAYQTIQSNVHSADREFHCRTCRFVVILERLIVTKQVQDIPPNAGGRKPKRIGEKEKQDGQ